MFLPQIAFQYISVPLHICGSAKYVNSERKRPNRNRNERLNIADCEQLLETSNKVTLSFSIRVRVCLCAGFV